MTPEEERIAELEGLLGHTEHERDSLQASLEQAEYDRDAVIEERDRLRGVLGDIRDLARRAL